MPTNPGFCDLCVNPKDSDPKVLRRTLTRLYKLGYETVAINRTVDESALDNAEKKKKKKPAEQEPAKNAVPEPLDLTDIREEFRDKLSILSRITFTFGDTAKVHTLGQSPILKKYDIYAVVPKTQAALQFACAQLAVDIVTVKSTNPGLKFTRKLYIQAVERGVHFEVQYADVLHRPTRKFALHYSHLFHMFGKSKNVIVSSGAEEETFLRNPYDVINLTRITARASLFGLCEVKAKAAVLAQCKHLLLKAEGRRYGKGVFSISTNRTNNFAKENEGEDCSNPKRIKL